MEANKMRAGPGDGSREQMGPMLHWLSRLHFQYCETCLQAVGIGHGQVPVLRELERHGELSQRALAEKVHVTPATMSGTLKRLERGGVIRRRESEKDARVSLVSLTEEGQELSERARGIFRMADHSMTDDLTDAECDEMLGLLRRMLKSVQEDLAAAAQRGEEDE